MVKIAGPIASGSEAATAAGLDHRGDIRRFAEIVDLIAHNEQEARHLRNWLAARTQAMLERPRARGVAAELRKRLDANGGRLDLNWPGRSTQPVAPVVNVTTPQPIVNITVETPPPANKTVEFEHDGLGNLVSATTTDAP